MGLEYEGLHETSPIVVDIETSGHPNADAFLEEIPDAVLDETPIEASKRLVDHVKIAADIEQKRCALIERNVAAVLKVEQLRATRRDRLALDWNVGRVVALGWWTEQSHIVCHTAAEEHHEALMIRDFWKAARNRMIVGFNIKGFDLKFLIQRSRYLNIAHPSLDLGKYTRRGIVDLFSELTFNEGTYDQGVMRRTLHAFCRRFGIPVDDTLTGADIPALVAAGEWDQIAGHCRSDVALELALAVRMGVITLVSSEVTF